MSDTNASPNTSFNQLAKLIGGSLLLFILHYGQEVLIPIVLAIFLALLIAPLIRLLRHWGLGQVQAVVVSVFLLFVGISATTVILTSQALRLVSTLPQYELTIRDKLQGLNRLTLGKLDLILSQADHLASKLSPDDGAKPGRSTHQMLGTQQPVLVQIEETHAKPFEIVSLAIKTMWPLIETSGIVFIVLIFILLDYESLRDRAIRLLSGGNLRTTTRAISEATERLSRFFVSQFAVNALVGALVAAGIGLAGLNAALFLGALTAVSRFIPYIGIWLAAALATVTAAAMSDGWTLMIQTGLIFLFVEIVIAQLFEPKLYGHSTGLSPLSVVISAIFWSALWGPVGLILATPLSLCLVVAGRYVPSLNFLEILLGDLSALNLAERFYQRALAGDPDELVHGLNRFLRDKPLHQYGDQVILGSIRLAYNDFSTNEITQNEHEKTKHSIQMLTEAMSHIRRLDKHGERRKEQLPATHRVLIIDLGDEISELLGKVLLNVFRSESLDARHLDRAALAKTAVSADHEVLAFVVCVAPEDHSRQLCETVAELHRLLPNGRLIVMHALEEIETPCARQTASECGADALVHSFRAAVDISYRLLLEAPSGHHRPHE